MSGSAHVGYSRRALISPFEKLSSTRWPFSAERLPWPIQCAERRELQAEHAEVRAHHSAARDGPRTGTNGGCLSERREEYEKREKYRHIGALLRRR